MIRSEFIQKVTDTAQVAYDNDLIDFSKYPTQHDARLWTNLVLNCLYEAIISDEDLNFSHFGKFAKTVRKNARARSPLTGEIVDVDPYVRLRFIPCADMKDALKALDPAVIGKPKKKPAKKKTEK